jgi:hypothetical protein
MGYPQISFSGAQSTMGDPTSFVYRRNRSFDVYEPADQSQPSHDQSSVRLFFREVQPRPIRTALAENFVFSNRWTSLACRATDVGTRLPTSCWVIEFGLWHWTWRRDSRTNWIHLFMFRMLKAPTD